MSHWRELIYALTYAVMVAVAGYSAYLFIWKLPW